MRSRHTAVLSLVATLLCLCNHSVAQTRIDLEAYKRYRAERKGMTTDGLMQEFPAGAFRSTVSVDAARALYADSIAIKYDITADELDLLRSHGFVVTERLAFDEYYRAYYDAYLKDLPVYISSDAVLHAFHRTYANILKDIEKHALADLLAASLEDMTMELRRIPQGTTPAAQQAYRDVDVYLAVARALILGSDATAPVDPAAIGAADSVLTAILAEQPTQLTTFTSVPRAFDFSQCKPRGHYAGDEVLERYFRTMMWLGRTEIYITAPQGVIPPVSAEDIRRQCGMAIQLARTMAASSARGQLAAIDTLLRAFLGDQDNVASQDVIAYVESRNLDVDALGDPSTLTAFQQAMIDAGGGQQILSQILISDATEEITPAASWMLMGQRFLYDSFVLANVVFDKTSELRMMPDPLDALFVLGNDATAQLLMPEITRWKYAENLAALRYLTNTFEPTYWEQSLYTSWLGAIRSLNPPSERSSLPQFMQTAAWWQKTINAQLASWAELRHDNLLYGKQSYTGGLGCFYPRGFVEPRPELYQRIGAAAGRFKDVLVRFAAELRRQGRPEQAIDIAGIASEALPEIESTMTVLASIATKELASIPLAVDEQRTIDEWIMRKDPLGGGCVTMYNGVYPSMLYGVSIEVNQQPVDHIIADVHTQPTDEFGAPVGRVLHVGTGKINMAVVAANDPQDGCLTAYVGPVSSYYEHITENFSRMTDQEWREHLKASPFPMRPSWTRLYLADKDGRKAQEQGPSLIVTSVNDVQQPPSSMLIAPNPTVAVAMITVSLPTAMQQVHVEVVDQLGQIVRTLDAGPMEHGNHHFRWDGMSDTGLPAVSAMYYVRLSCDGIVTTQPLVIGR